MAGSQTHEGVPAAGAGASHEGYPGGGRFPSIGAEYGR